MRFRPCLLPSSSVWQRKLPVEAFLRAAPEAQETAARHGDAEYSQNMQWIGTSGLFRSLPYRPVLAAFMSCAGSESCQWRPFFGLRPKHKRKRHLGMTAMRLEYAVDMNEWPCLPPAFLSCAGSESCQ